MPTAPRAPASEDVELTAEQHGSRWYHAPPTGEDFAAWFATNVKLHDGMEHAPYVTGCVLIGSTEKYKVTVAKPNGEEVIIPRQRQVFVPYAKVETRVAYFWDLMQVQEGVIGMIEPVPMTRLNDAGYVNYNLPPGFFRLPIGIGGGIANYLGCAMKVSLYREGSLEWIDREEEVRAPDGTITTRPFSELRGIPAAVYPSATKVVPVLNNGDEEDPYAVMKAETGAVGRALGMAGMLVIPGSGVATADDMLETENIRAGTASPSLPAVEAATPVSTEDVKEVIKEKFDALDEAKQEDVKAWAASRSIDLFDLKDTQTRATLAAIERAAK